MSEGFIVPIRSFGREFAFISVNYPEGSTCTCTHSEKGKVLTAGDTSGTWIFVVPYKGTWTVNATDGTNSNSQDVAISTEGQSESVTLIYTIYLFNKGSVNSQLTGGWTSSGYTYYSSNYKLAAPTIGTTLKLAAEGNNNTMYTCIAGTKNKIDLSGIKTLYVKVTAHGTGGGGLSLNENKNCHSSSAVASLSLTAVKTYSLDVSKINKAVYIAAYIATSTSVHNRSLTINQIWLESEAG